MEEDKNTTNEVPSSGTETVETTAAPEITVEQIKEVSARIEELNRMRGELEAKKREFDIHMKDLENIRTVYGEASKQFDAKRDVIKFTDNEMKGLEDNIGKRSFKRSELKPYLDAVTDMFDKERSAQASREYKINIGDYKTWRLLLDYCRHSMMWTAKSAPALMTLSMNLEENNVLANSKKFDGEIMLRSGNVLALHDFLTNKMEGKGWNTAKDFLSCWANCGKSLVETVRQIQGEYETVREYAGYLQNIDNEFGASENDIPEEDVVATKDEISVEI
jgi:hypothetical protein